MAVLQRQIGAQRLQQKADPQLLMTNRLLQMSQMELRQHVAQELAENPALDSAEDQACGNCDIPGIQCADCPMGLAGARLGSAADGPRLLSETWSGEEDVDPLALAEAPQTLQDHLLEQLKAAGGPADEMVGRYLIANIDNDGYLRCSVEEAVEVLRVRDVEVERVLRLIQSFDPAGVGARTLQECLLIQAHSLAAERQAPAHLVTILEDHWKEMVSSRWSVIARRLRVTPAEVEQTVGWLRRNLSPYPGHQYRPSWEKSRHRSRLSVRPDVIIFVDEQGELRFDIVGEEAPAVNVNRQYMELWQQMRGAPESYGAAERQHVRDYLMRAQMFLKSLEDRGSILRRLTECLTSEQEQYLLTEREEDMQPLTQSQVASFLQVHESTISRAVADKYLQLPSGRVVPFTYFFDRALCYRKLVANVVAAEDPASPYSDQEISDILRRQGIQIARRTVMKYREEMNILSSRQRTAVRN